VADAAADPPVFDFFVGPPSEEDAFRFVPPVPPLDAPPLPPLPVDTVAAAAPAPFGNAEDVIGLGVGKPNPGTTIPQLLASTNCRS
jgi:hypothetical protein